MNKIAESIDEQKNVTLDGEVITSNQFNERLRDLNRGERIVETSEDNFSVIHRMNG